MTQQRAMKLMVVACEASGDRLGAALVDALRAKGVLVTLVGVGGPKLAEMGLKSAVPMADVAVMGLTAVLPRLPTLRRHMATLVALAASEQPDALVTIDSYEFASRLARKVAKLPGLAGMPRVHYNPPKVWAWRQGRVATLACDFTQLLSILPFEAPWFVQAGVPCTYVGHPMVTTLTPLRLAEGAPRALSVALLPGSRTQELVVHWPVLLATFRRLKTLMPALTAVLVLPTAEAEAVCRGVAEWGIDDGIQVVHGEARFAAMALCKAAIAKSGTNTLELAMLGIPAVVGYMTSGLTYWLAKRLVRVPYVALPNLVLDFKGHGQPVYPEFLQKAFTPQNLTRAVYPLLSDAKAWQHQQVLLAEVQARMATKMPPAAAAAEVVLKTLG
jgi:lipid-A-disaccharide synthase